ncbi:hypothetical protein KLK17_12815 [Clostridioides difficile]|nr:hypothetical protein [Clostridioides difficile]
METKKTKFITKGIEGGFRQECRNQSRNNISYPFFSWKKKKKNKQITKQ